MNPERCDGILLAAGAGRRYGMPKVLAEDGVWLRSAVEALRAGGCSRIFVVLGATGPAHRTAAGAWLVSQTSGIPLPPGVHPVWAADWKIGVSASMRAGLAAAATPRLSAAGREFAGRTADSSLAARTIPAGNIATGNSGPGKVDDGPAGYAAIMPVDTPDVGGAVVARVIAAAQVSESRLARAVFGGVPGHPVVLGRAHWAGACASAAGNSGAGTYLRQRADMVCVTCDDRATGIDRDYPAGGAR
ncbi:NTP transferase domain-containing protein [Nocardia seriolae]|uniref:nucleotidyltransferase family protein n=1 Tax=Nocardia seriolae TaxID=37332 RepID=UPI002E32CD58|nr:NTP transferase domain-containing protein [Nocardia seriolae]